MVDSSTMIIVLFVIGFVLFRIGNTELDTAAKYRKIIRQFVDDVVPQEKVYINEPVKVFWNDGIDVVNHKGEVYLYDGFAADQFRENLVNDYTNYLIHGDGTFHSPPGEGKAVLGSVLWIIALPLAIAIYGESVSDSIINFSVDTVQHIWRIMVAVWKVGDK